jgi:hypothetical protein
MSFSAASRWNELSQPWANVWLAEVSLRTSSWSVVPPWPWAYDATRVTRDIDATFVPHGVVIEEARHVSDDLGLPYWWLSEQASIYISGKDDPGKRRVFDHPRLRCRRHRQPTSSR